MNKSDIKNAIIHSPTGILVTRIGIMMLIYSLCRLLFYAFNHSLFPGVDGSQLVIIFLAGMRFDLTAVLYFNLLYILLFIIPHRLHHKKAFIKWTNILFYVTNGIAIFMNNVDFIYYRFTNRRTSIMVFNEFAGETNYLQLLYHFAIDYFYIPLIFAALIFFLIYITKKQYIIKSKLPLWKYFIYNVLLMCIIAGLTVIGVRGGLPPKQDFPLNPSDAGQYVEHPNDIALVLNTPFTMLLSMDKPAFPSRQYFSSEAELDSIYFPVHQVDTTRLKRPLNIVVIMVESLGRETIGFYNQNMDSGRYKGYTPFLDSLCKSSYVFMNSYANSHISIEGSPAIAASIPSLQESFTVSLYSGNKIMSLANCLNDLGYQSYYFHGAPNGSLGLNSFAKKAGFEYYVGKTEYNNDTDFDGVWGIWDHKFLPYVANYLNNVKSPFLAYIFTASSHHPFRLPKELKDKFPEGKVQIHKSISYADYSIGEFFSYAKKQSWFNNTIFVISGDHTCTPYYPEFKTTAGAYAVPIIFYQPDSKLIGIDSTVAQQIDIMPTLLNYIGYDKPFFAFGNDLFAQDSTRFAVNYIGNTFQLINKDWVLQFDLEKTISLYHLQSDPLLTNNLVGKNMEVQATLEKQIKAFIQQYNGRMVNNRMTVN